MRLLADGVPITLLCDLVPTSEPDSQTINLNERPPGDLLLAEAVAVMESERFGIAVHSL
jgi:hypothetical protein